ncbi:hypothetical protein STAQ_20350 [Allostella sp. ATCC 35155]|nr:hypothetical protein STAQ_20350 [Stella sp. ATCC 35155]
MDHTVQITWNWGVHETIAFDPSHQILDFGWITGDYIEISEVDGSVVIELPSNQRSITLAGVTLDELSLSNITANDPSTLDVWAAALEGEDDGGMGGDGGHGGGHAIAITWNYGVHETIQFDPSHQMLDFGWITGEHIEISEVAGSVVIALPGNMRSITLDGVTLDELSLANIMANDQSTLDVWAAALDGEDDGGMGGDGGHGGGHAVTITWNYGVHETIQFDPSHQMLDFGWITGEYVEISEVGGSVVIELLGNMRSITLDGVTLDELSLDNIMANDQSTLDVWAAALDGDDDGGMGGDGGHGHGGDHILMLALNPGVHAMLQFDPTHQVLDFGSIDGDDFTVAEVEGSVVIALPAAQQSYTLMGVTLDEMSLANVTADDQSVLDAWEAVLGDEGTQDPDLPAGGTLYQVSTSGADIVGFDPATDRLDLGQVSVHVFIPVDTPEGLGFMNPWNGNIQIIDGINLGELDVGNFSPVWNSHLLHDLSGALTWEHGIVEQPNTVYARSHEMNQVDRVAFDPETDRVDFRYYGTRELISMYQLGDDVVIANGGTGQKLVLLGTDIGDLDGGNFIFHAAQVYEDHLDQQLGITFDPANVWSRPSAVDAGAGSAMGASDGVDGYPEAGVTTTIAWSWGSHDVLDFDPSEDRLDFGFLTTQQATVDDTAEGILITLVGGNRTYLLEALDFADLQVDNVLAADASMIAAWAGYLS